MKKILIVFGTRPEAIKMAPVVKEFLKFKDEFELKVCVTGQHREMLDQVLRIFDIKPDKDLNIMKHGQDLFDVTSTILNGLKEYFKEYKPDYVLVHGDTTTSMATALSAFYMQIPVAHVEAGLRTHNKYSPWPEEMNRSITGRISEFHFSPTTTSKDNLLAEGIDEKNILVTGNTVIDSLFLVLERIKKDQVLLESIHENLADAGISSALLNEWIDKKRKLVLITGHRRENFGSGFEAICNAIVELAKQHPLVDFLYPVHLNPNVRKPVNDIIVSSNLSNIIIIEPLDYLPFVYLMDLSYIIMTDSGGIQEEAPSLGKPVLVMRDTTERPEAVAAGTVKLVGTDYDVIIAEVNKLILNESEYLDIKTKKNPFGEGNSSAKIVEFFRSL
ncbi:UDP-N-acetylglucosamine 2-epimerase [Pedobacter antarcticus 4BY]|uniref:UDP-N-acetylglucosamine 2-epimerase (non-hydrolyzing) n=2 Tax=Pedobacter antarcticus TaxID=34086 RepID=A0A081PE05_9SPHI|nr:UDP-N-acetylglucosamine 2-epimerase [Pedobacter antarcticus 4BY]